MDAGSQQRREARLTPEDRGTDVQATEAIMKRSDFEGMCELAREGRLTWVENIPRHETGRVVDCGTDTVTVDFGGARAEWRADDCRELTHGYRVNYDEVKRYPHEFDTHRD